MDAGHGEDRGGQGVKGHRDSLGSPSGSVGAWRWKLALEAGVMSVWGSECLAALSGSFPF